MIGKSVSSLSVMRNNVTSGKILFVVQRPDALVEVFNNLTADDIGAFRFDDHDKIVAADMPDKRFGVAHGGGVAENIGRELDGDIAF